MDLPDSVTITEVGMRDGFQFENQTIPTSLKIDILNRLVDSGLSRIQVTSFVHPNWVPQMADAEEICSNLPENKNVTYTALALNTRGVVRANNAGIKHLDLSVSTNDQHSQDNTNMSREDAIDQAIEMADLAHSCGMQIQMGLQCVFGYKNPGDTPVELIMSMTERFLESDLESLSLADSTGLANPRLITYVLDHITSITGNIPIVLHLHDTRGLGLANVYAALSCGVRHFDTSFGGLGGCPFIPGATGNIATEDTVYLLESIGIETGVDQEKLAAVTTKVADFLGRDLPGKLYRLTYSLYHMTR